MPPAPTPPDAEAPAQPLRPVVGIGASAGGLEAIQRLLSRITTEGMAFVVVQHLAAGRESSMQEILSRATHLKVVTIQEGMPIEPDRVYVAPPDADLWVDGRVFRLSALQPLVPRHNIDAFLQSLAKSMGQAAIGVILSGSGNDGTVGLRAIAEEGGLTFVQSPGTAGQASMPQAAIDADLADFVLSPEEIGDELTRLGSHPYVARGTPRPFEEEPLSLLFAKLRATYGVDFAAYKRGTIERRIQRRILLRKLEALPEYLRYLESNPSELGILYGDLLIGVTDFFRDRELFEALKTTVFPRIIEGRNPDLPIRMWVAGCSTGEEAYSLAIALLEYLGDRAGSYKVQIFATDIDDKALETARHAIYPRTIEKDLPPERLRRFFAVEEKGYRVNRQVRDMVVFARHNLGKDPPFSRLDLVSCRNVLIYMQPALQRRILQVFHYALAPTGVLVLGLSESVGEASDLFGIADRRVKLFTRQNVLMPPLSELGFHMNEPEPAPDRRPTAAMPRPMPTLQQLADRKLLERYSPPGVLVTADLDVLQFRGRTGPYLNPTPGTATLNLLKLVRADLAPLLRESVNEAIRTRHPATSPPARTGDPQVPEVRIDVLPVATDLGAQACYLVLFREEGMVPQAARPGEPALAVPGDPRIEKMERELAATKDSLQASIEELEAANEELQSANEELQSSNEELQSTNEELETSKEELQSTNEELATVNDELQNRMDELTVTSDDLKNVLASISNATLVVSSDLRIRAFSAAAEKLLNLVPNDVGRPVAYLRTMMMARDLEQSVLQVISTVTAREQRVRSTDGYWYAMRLLPYKTTDNVIRGAVLEFVRAPATTRSPGHGELGDLATEVLATVPQALLLLDDQLRLFWANRAFFTTFQVDDDVFGQPLEQVWSGRNVEPELWTLLEEATSGGKGFSSVIFEHPFGVTPAPPMSFSAKRIPGVPDRPPLTLVIMEPRAERNHG